MPLPSQTSEIDAQLAHADGFVAMGQVVLALGMYRTAGLLAEQRGDLPRALAIAARIARIDPDPGARTRIGELQLAVGQRAEAAVMLDGVVRDELRSCRCPQALHAATIAATAVPTIARHRMAAELAQMLGHVDLAVDHFHAAAIEELAQGRAAQARSLCTHALGLRPNHLPTLRTAIDAHLRTRDIHRAVAAIKGILARDPHDAVALESMAEAFAMLGKKQNAAEVVRLLAVRLQSAGPAAQGDARALVHRGLGWHPECESLRQLDRDLTDRPRAVARELPPRPPAPRVTVQAPPKAESTRVIDLADLVEVRQVVRPAVPIRRTTPPAPVRRTDGYATRPAAR